MPIEWYDRKGNPITIAQAEKLMRNFKYKVVAKTKVGDKEVSTVWLGLDHRFDADPLASDKPPIIFETMIFPQGDIMMEEYMERYSTEEEAIAGHKKAVEELRLFQQLEE